MWLTSNRPTRSRTARCSSRTPLYSTGMSQPPKSTILAPMPRWTALRGVRFSSEGAAVMNNQASTGVKDRSQLVAARLVAARLRGTDHLEAIAGPAIRHSSHAADGAKFFGIDVIAAVDDGVVHMKAKDLAQNQVAAQGFVAHLDDLHRAALHVDVRFEHARRADEVAGNRSESGDLKLVYFGRIVAGAKVHLFRDLFADDVDHEFAGGLDVDQRVFRRSARVGGEANHWRIAADSVEEAEGREIEHAAAGDGGDEADGPRNDRPDQNSICVGCGDRCGINGHSPDYGATSPPV